MSVNDYYVYQKSNQQLIDFFSVNPSPLIFEFIGSSHTHQVILSIFRINTPQRLCAHGSESVNQVKNERIAYSHYYEIINDLHFFFISSKCLTQWCLSCTFLLNNDAWRASEREKKSNTLVTCEIAMK